jgi:flagellar biosynthesis/type III secretory pathway chaperone
MVSSEKDLLEYNKMNQIQIKNMTDEKEVLLARLERMSSNKDDELKRSEYLKAEELKRQREVLYDKIKSVFRYLTHFIYVANFSS